MATKLRKAKRGAPVRRAARKTSRSSSKISARRRVAAARGKAKPKTAPRKQTFVASHLTPDAFESGLRTYAKYRDLGMAAATHGLAQAPVIKMIPPCDPAGVARR